MRHTEHMGRALALLLLICLVSGIALETVGASTWVVIAAGAGAGLVAYWVAK